MTREELAGKTKQSLIEIAKSLGIRGYSKLTREELVEHILLLDPPFSASSIQEKQISQYLTEALAGPNNFYTQQPIPGHPTGVATFEDHYEQNNLPNYNDTRIILMVRDPYWLHTYWGVSHEAREEISNKIKCWDHLQLILRVYDITNVLEFDGKNSNFNFDIYVDREAANWYIHVGGPNRTFCVDLGFFKDDGTFYTITRSNIVTTPRDNISEIVDEEWMIIEQDFRRLYFMAGGTTGNSSAELVESLMKRLENEMGSGGVSSLSSPMGKFIPKERQFWLVLNTELIVYGATEPDAKVTVQGEPIELRPDGTFTMRFNLPDGIQYIPVSARSADEVDTITITPVVTKQTT